VNFGLEKLLEFCHELLATAKDFIHKMHEHVASHINEFFSKAELLKTITNLLKDIQAKTSLNKWNDSSKTLTREYLGVVVTKMNEVAGLLMKNIPFSSAWGYAWDTIKLCDYEEQKTTSVGISNSNRWSLEEDVALVKFLYEEKLNVLKLPANQFLQAAQFIHRCCPNKKERRKFAILGRLQFLKQQWKDSKVEDILKQLQTKLDLFSTPIRADEQ